MTEALELEGQLAIVTGASGEIGGAIALELGRKGAFIAGTTTSEDGVDKIQTLLDTEGLEGYGEVLDLTKPETFGEYVEQVHAVYEARHGKIIEKAGVIPVSILVNNAGTTRDGLEMRMSPADWNDVVAINLSGMHFLTQAVVKEMFRAKYGRIINNSSVVGISGNPGQTNYAATKAGMIGYTKALAKELASRGITVNAVAPGYVVSRLTEVLSDDVKQTMVDHTPIGRPVTADEVAYAVGFLASPRASGLTAEVIRVDGGLAA